MSPVVRQSGASEERQSSRTDVNAIRDPSGDQAGQPSGPGESVSWTGSVPSTSTAQMSYSPDRLPPMNGIRRPSGDHVGYSTQRSVGIRRRCEPSGSTRNPPIGCPSLVELNTIQSPVGDHAGPQSLPGSSLMSRGFDPSASIT